MGHMTWRDEQIAQYRAHHALGTMAAGAGIAVISPVASRTRTCSAVSTSTVTVNCRGARRRRRSTGKT
jgi:hypothetical protein